MNTAPSNKPSNDPQPSPENKDNSPSPSEILAIFLNWLQHYWDAPREKSKWTDIATVALTLLIAVAAFWSAWVFQAQLTEARRATEITERQWKQHERPWVSAKISLFEPLSFSNKAGRLGVSYTLKNSGHSVALDVRFISKVVPLYSTREIYQQQAILCDPFRKRATQDGLPGNILFPGDPLEGAEVTDMSPEDISEGLKRTPLAGEISPILIACVDYRFTFAPEHHQTRYAYPLGRPQPQGGWIGFFAPSGTPAGVVLIGSLIGEYAD